VSNAYAGLTLVWDQPLNKKLSAYVEGGYGVTSRSGIVSTARGATAGTTDRTGRRRPQLSPVADVRFPARRDLLAGARAFDHPSTRMYTVGARYNMARFREKVAENRDAGFYFPLNIVRAGITTNLLTYGANDLFGKYIVIFWPDTSM